MKNSLVNVRQTLHELLKTLPAVRANCSQEVVHKHIALIAYYQKLYDQLAGPTAVPA